MTFLRKNYFEKPKQILLYAKRCLYALDLMFSTILKSIYNSSKPLHRQRRVQCASMFAILYYNAKPFRFYYCTKGKSANLPFTDQNTKENLTIYYDSQNDQMKAIAFHTSLIKICPIILYKRTSPFLTFLTNGTDTLFTELQEIRERTTTTNHPRISINKHLEK